MVMNGYIRYNDGTSGKKESASMYTIEYIDSVGLTLLAYLLVVYRAFSGWSLVMDVSVLVIVQLIVALMFLFTWIVRRGLISHGLFSVLPRW